MTVNNTALSKTVEKFRWRSICKRIDKLQKCRVVGCSQCHQSRVPLHFNYLSRGKGSRTHIIRAKGCKGGVENVGKCEACRKLDNALHNSVEIQKIHPNRPLNRCAAWIINKWRKNIRSDNKQLKKSGRIFEKSQEAVSVDEDVSEGLFSTLQSKSKDSGNQLMELFGKNKKRPLLVIPGNALAPNDD